MTPNRKDIHKEIHAVLDAELFDQMVRNGAFELSDLSKIVAYTFEKLMRYVSECS
jgi:hypothetical protein